MWSSPTVVIENTPFYHICQLLLRVFEVIRYVFLRWFIKLLSIIILLNSYLLFVTILFLTKYAVSHISALNSYLLFLYLVYLSFIDRLCMCIKQYPFHQIKTVRVHTQKSFNCTNCNLSCQLHGKTINTG